APVTLALHDARPILTRYREHAVRLYQAIRRYIEKYGFTDCATLVAFSGTLTVDGIDYTEAKLNGFPESALPAKFAYTKVDDPHRSEEHTSELQSREK